MYMLHMHIVDVDINSNYDLIHKKENYAFYHIYR